MNPDALLLAGVLVLTVIIAGPGTYLIYAGLRRIPPSVYAEMENAMSDMNRQLIEIRAQQAADHVAMSKLQVRVTDLEIGVRVLSAQVRRLGEEPEYKIPDAPALVSVKPANDRALAQTIAALFNRDEIDDLAFRLGINGEEISGDTVTKRARSLVDYARRHSVTEELIATARQLRPEGDI